MTASRRRDVACLVAATAALLAYWRYHVLAHVGAAVTFAGSDLSFQFLPDYAYLAGRLRAGAVPLWNPLHGQPFLATLLPGTLYPARLLLFVLDVPTAMHVSTVVHLVLSFVATFGLARALGAGAFGAATAGAVFVGVHDFPAIYWPNFLEGGAWLPVAAFALVRLAATGAWRWTLALGASVGMVVLAGCYQHALYVGYGLGVVALALLADPSRRGRLASRSTLARLAVAVVLAAATAAPQALPTLAWGAGAIRSGAPLTDVQIDPYPFPGRIWDAMFPGWGRDSLMLVSTPVLAVAALGRLATRGFGLVLAIGLAGAIALALGRGTPVFGVVHVLPGFTAFRSPERLLFLVAFFAAIGVAFGVDGLARGPRVLRPLAVASALAIGWNLFAPQRIDSALPWTLPPAAIAGPSGLMALVAEHTAGGRTLFTGGGAGDGLFVKQPGLHAVLALEDYNPLSSRRLAAYLRAVEGEPPTSPSDPDLFLGFLSMKRAIVRPALLDMASVRTILIASQLAMPVRSPPFRPLAREKSWTLYENPLALPRAYTIARARFVSDDAAALDALATVDPRDEVVLVAQGAPVDGPPGSLREARITVDEPERVVVEAHVDRPEIAVLTDAIAPGWTARVNDVAAELLPANHLGRGVAVPPGNVRVELTYRAPGFEPGLLAFAAAWTAVVAGAGARAVRVRVTAGAARSSRR